MTAKKNSTARIDQIIRAGTEPIEPMKKLPFSVRMRETANIDTTKQNLYTIFH